MGREPDLNLPPPKPGGIDRRTFVKGCIAAAGIGALGAGLAPFANTLSAPKKKARGTFTYVGTQLKRGPAQVGLPLIPITVNEAGELVGIPDKLAWYRYCGRTWPGLDDGATEENKFHFFVKRKANGDAQFPNLWYVPLDRQVMTRTLFEKVGDGAIASWRSEGLTGNDVMIAFVVRIDPDKFQFPAALEPELAAVIKESGFVAFNGACVHACCVPGYKEADLARTEADGAFWESIYCTCHGSVYGVHGLDIYSSALLPP
ncbi:MAG: twin-arginine translocation signal domain-containing protein [Methanobacteriota archaeon]